MIILYLSLIFSCVYLGVVQSRKLQERQLFYENLRDFLSQYRSNINFLQKEFIAVVEEYNLSNNSGVFSKLLVSHVHGTDEKIEFLSEKENAEVKSILSSLGQNDEDTETKLVESAISLIKTRTETATKRAERYSSFSVKLGLLVGVLLVILLL